MKHEKRRYNQLLLKYNKYTLKLARFQGDESKEHRQKVLQGHIEKLHAKLTALLARFKRMAVIGSLAIAFFGVVDDAAAQTSFGTPQIGALGLPGNGGGGGGGGGNLLGDLLIDLVDIDGDGDLDIVSVQYDDIFRYYENTGTAESPTFTPAQNSPFGLAHPNYQMFSEFADMDGDGDFDLLTGDYYGDFYYYENTGSATAPVFGAIQTNPFGLTDIGNYNVPLLVDFDADGDFDLLTINANGQYWYFENVGSAVSPSFGAGQLNPFGLSNTGGSRARHEFIDLDRDGDFDLLTVNNSGDYSYVENVGTALSPAFSPSVLNPFGIVPVGFTSDFVVGDVDSDGNSDLIIVQDGGAFEFIENTSVSTAVISFGPKQTNPFSLTDIGVYSTPTYADIDSDGDLDILSGEAYGDFKYFENTGTAIAPIFGTVQTNPFGLSGIGNYTSPVFVDLDSDGDYDILSGMNTGALRYFENTGTSIAPSYTAPLNNPFGLVNVSPSARPTFVDVDHDGDLDLLVGKFNGDFSYFENVGSATVPSFGAVQNNPYGLSGVGTVSDPTFGDLDFDGDWDALVGDFNGGNFNFQENIGGALVPVFALPQVNPFGLTSIGNKSAPVLLDLDRDGDLDVLSGAINGNFYYFEGDVCETYITAPADVIVSTDPGVCESTSVVLGTPTLAACAGEVVSNDAPIIFPTGNTTVTWTLTDSFGTVLETETQTVTVNDLEPPSASCAEIDVYLDGSGLATITGSDLDAGSTDNCGIASFSTNITTFDCSDLGVVSPILTVTDLSGNTNTCTALVNVFDTLSPSVICQDINVFLDANGLASISTGDVDGGTTDNCGVSSLAIDVNSFDCTNTGTNNVVLTATDASGNTSSCTAVVTVLDISSLNIVCQDITVYLDANGQATISAGDVDGGTTDNCGVSSLAIDINSFDCTDIGANNVTLTATDASGTPSSCTAVVTVMDTLSPIIVCQNFTVYLDASGQATISAADVDGGTTENCGMYSVSIDVNNFDCTNTGTNNVILTAIDASGNTSSCTAVVTVSDTLSPTISCPVDETTIIGVGTQFTLPDYVALGSTVATDNCPTTITQTPLPGTLVSVGVQTISFEAQDASGNLANCAFDLTVESDLSLDELGQDNIKMYPNPVNNELTIISNNGLSVSKITISDAAGRSVKTVVINDKQTLLSIDVSDLTPSIYFVTIKTNKGPVTKRLIKN